MTDGKYVGPMKVKDLPTNLKQSYERALDLWDGIVDFVDSISTVRRVFLVGAGGSLIAFQPMQYLLDRFARVPVTAVNSDEFFYRKPVMDEDVLVIAQSGGGNTHETVRAAEWAAQEGAVVLGVTGKEDGKLAQSLENVFVSEGGGILLQLVALALLHAEGFDVNPYLTALRALPDAVDSTVEKFEPRAAEVATIMKDVPVTYVMASGPLVGAADTFSSCYLQEMQWKDATTINCNEFFQGPFEIVDPRTKTIVFLGEDTTRPMGERVKRFLDEYSGQTVYLDSRDLEFKGIDPEMRWYVAPIVYSTLVARLAAYYSAMRGYTLEGRRYMWQFDY